MKFGTFLSALLLLGLLLAAIPEIGSVVILVATLAFMAYGVFRLVARERRIVAARHRSRRRHGW